MENKPAMDTCSNTLEQALSSTFNQTRKDIMTKAKNETKAKAKNEVTLEKFETIVLTRATKGLPFEALILASPFSSQTEMRELEGLVLQRAKQARKQALIDGQALIREERALLMSMGLSAQERQVHLSELVSRKNKPKEEKTSPNLSNFMVFIDMLSTWHKECHGKEMPKTWVNANDETKLSNGTLAVIYLLWQAAKDNMDASKLFQNQTDLNNKVRQLTGSAKYNNPNSAKVFGHFLRWIESN